MKLGHGLVLVVLAAGCDANQSGNVSASKSGDTTHPAERRSPLSALRDACGTGDATDHGAALVARGAYLQQVTTTGARVGWVTMQPDGAAVALSTPGSSVQPIVAQVETRAAGANQMWAEIDALSPASIYCYALADAGGAVTSPTGLRTAPTANDPAPLRFLAFGDSGGGGSDQYALLEQMYTVPYELMIHTGDVAYESGTEDQFEANVFDVYADLFRNIPFFPAAGNHDYGTAQGAPFRDVFNLPGEEKWYSFDYGRVHFVALDTEESYETQAAWLARDLAATPLTWKIVYLHRPPYSSGNHGSDTALRAVLAPILARYGVQLVLAGHDHDYERTTPIDGTTYIVTGGGGRGTYSVGSSSFTAFSDSVIHFVYGEVTADEMTLHAIDASGREFDSVVIPHG